MFSALRKLLNVAIALLILNALYRFVPTYVDYVQFRDAVKELIIFSRNVPDSQLIDQIVRLAGEHQVPVDRDDVLIRHDNLQIFIDASYVKPIAFLPTYTYPWEFEVKADALHATPPGGLAR